jgi:hypothetical protein
VTDVGGLAGVSFGTVTFSTATGPVTGESEVGGLVGRSGSSPGRTSTAVDAVARGDVTGTANVGGLVGHVESGGGSVTLSNVSASGRVDGGDATGGLVGRTDGGTISVAESTGTVSGDTNVGGFVGVNQNGAVRNASATGAVTGGQFVGGFAGVNQGPSGASLVDTYARGAVAGTSEVGGLVGFNNGGVSASYATGAVTGSQNVGGLVGIEGSSTTTDAYWDVETTGQPASAGGTGLTTAEMTGLAARENLVGFAIPEPWLLTDGYPVLDWESAGPFYAVTIDSATSPVVEGERLDIVVTVTNYGQAGTQELRLTDTGFSTTVQDTRDVTLDTGGTTTITVAWTPEVGDVGDGALTVSSDNHSQSVDVAVTEPSGGGGTLDGGNGSADSADGDSAGSDTGGTDDGSDDDGANGGTGGGSDDTTNDGASRGGGGGGGSGGSSQSASTPDSETSSAPTTNLTVENATLPSGTITAGESVELEVTVSNRGAQTDQFTFVLAANGTTLAEETVAVAVNTTRTIPLEITVEEPGTYAVTLNGEPVGDLLVAPGSAEPAPPADPTGETVSSPSESPEGVDDPVSTADSDGSLDETPSRVPGNDAEAISEPSGLASEPGLSLLVGILAVLLFAGVAAWWRRSN